MYQEYLRKQRKLLAKKIIFWVGIGLVLLGYGFLFIPAETPAVTAITRAFTGLGLVIGGAILWLGAVFFK